jgi:DNA sulfur modification protein DndC
MLEALELTRQSLSAYGLSHPHWAVAWSGGKDSTATLSVILYLIESGQIPPPLKLTVFYADTRQELPPLAIAARQIIEELKARGIDIRIVCAPLDKRFLVYILGRGVPPPNNNTLRWCTRQIKVDPMSSAIAEELKNSDETTLMITGVRQGESAIRDRRIEMSCSKDGGECGQGWYQQVLPESKGIRGKIATLAPLLHWRVCHVWDWLRFYGPSAEYGGLPTGIIADAYGGNEAEEINARTGCIGCPLASKDTALDAIVAMPQWTYLSPLKSLRPLYWSLRNPMNRIRKSGIEKLKSGGSAKNPQRMGPLTFKARLSALNNIIKIQDEINASAIQLNRPIIDLLNSEEISRILELIKLKTWPHGWTGDEPEASIPLSQTIYSDGSTQSTLFS